MNLLSLLLNEDSGEGHVGEELEPLQGSSSSRAENMLLRSHLILICHGAFARRRPPAVSEPSVTVLPVLLPHFHLFSSASTHHFLSHCPLVGHLDPFPSLVTRGGGGILKAEFWDFLVFC